MCGNRFGTVYIEKWQGISYKGGGGMFNMTKIKAVRGDGRSFYMNHLSSNDYYSEHEKVIGHWRGELAGDFGLWARNAESEEFCRFQRNINPMTGEKLTKRTVTGGIRFFDFQCAAPKSVSVLTLFDPRLVKAHEEAVFRAMDELERLAAVRVRVGENAQTRNYRITGQLVYAQFTHDTSRSLDPQLHTHNVVVNVTKDEDGSYKALEALEMCRAIRYAGKVYHNHLARKCRELGYETVAHRDEKGRIVWFDLEGVPEEVMEMFSKRRKEIEAEEQKFLEEHGRKPTLAENNFLSMTTRSNKMKSSTADKVRKFQINQLSPDQRNKLNEIVRNAARRGNLASPVSQEQYVQMIRDVLPQLYERESVLKLDKVLGETLNQNLGHVDLKMLKQAVREVPELRDLGGLDENPWFSTQEVIDRELYAIETVERQKELLEPIAPEFVAFPGEESRSEQAGIIHALLKSKDRYNLFRGVAGSGKTSTLQELCRGLRSGGMQHIYLIAPTNSAVDVLKGEGFELSSTVASFLQSPRKPPEGSYVIIDESGLNSLREGTEIIRLANENNYRVLFVGDSKQHSAVESGDFFRLLGTHSKIAKFYLSQIRRQQTADYRKGINYCAGGYFEAALDTFQESGFIHEGKNQYLQQAAESFLEFTENGRYPAKAILVAPTHDECDRLTEAVREKLKESGAIAKEGWKHQVFRSWQWEKARIADISNYRPGMAVSFVRKIKDVAEPGETAVIESVRDGMLHFDNGKSIHLRRSSGFIEPGEFREIELCPGDIIQFGVNLKERKIYNGNLAKITADPGKVMMLNYDGSDRELAELPANCSAINHGWVTTSYKSQGRTADTVVVAAQEIDRKSFYVALSRGRLNMALHCPDKEFLKERLMKDDKQRLSVHDLVENGEIPNAALKRQLPEEVRQLATEKLPDTGYKSVDGRLKKLKDRLKGLAGRVAERGRKVLARRCRNARYGFGIVTEKTLFEVEREHALETPPAEISAGEPEKPEKMKPKTQFDKLLDWLDTIGRESSRKNVVPAVTVPPQPVTPRITVPENQDCPRPEEYSPPSNGTTKFVHDINDVSNWLEKVNRELAEKQHREEMAEQASNEKAQREAEKAPPPALEPEKRPAPEPEKPVLQPERIRESKNDKSRGMDL